MSESSKKADMPGMGRTRRGGKSMILMMFLSILALAVILLFLFVKVYEQEQMLARLSGQVERLTRVVQENQAGQEEPAEDGKLTGDFGEGQVDEEKTGDATGESGDKPDGEGKETVGLPEDGDSQTEDPEDIEEGDLAAHKVYLTFDDGPSIYTDEILDILDEYDVKATFFVVGKDSDRAREAMQEIVARGHTLGMHSYSHKYSQIYASVDAFADDFAKIREYIYEVTGQESTVYRFPGGSSNTVSNLDMWLFADYLETQDVRFFDWNISSGDGGSQILPVETLLENCTKGILDRETNVVLMHDSAEKHTTIEALPALIEKIQAMEDVAILPITEKTHPVQHIHREE